MNEITRILSRDNSRLVAARKVRDGKTREQIFIEGLRLAEEMLRSQLPVSDCFFTEAFGTSERGRELIDALMAKDIPVSEVPESLLRSLADTANTQGIVLIAGRPGSGPAAIEQNMRSADPASVIFLHEINDPSNLGAVFRTAEAAGVAGTVVSKNSADAFSPKAVRAAMGANLRIPVWENADFADVLRWSKNHGLITTAADIRGGIEYTKIDWKLSRLVVFGSEAHGISREVLEATDELILIPMQNGVESLNLAVSAGIILFEAIRQRSN